jgi:glycosyltransferase involved in cell wall biosynthesis
MEKISAIIVCTREEGNIQQCLESIRFVDEIVIIDSGATERTLEICREFTDRIVSHPWPSYGQQMEYARELVKNEWVLNLGVNEVVSDKLRENIISALENDGGKCDAYRISLHYFYSGQRINRCWKPELQIRLYRRSKARWVRQNLHYSLVLDGKCRDLKGELKYSPYQDLARYLNAINSLSTIKAREKSREGKAEGIFGLVVSPLFHFLKLYGLQRGFLDGRAGFVISILESYRRFMESEKLWEMRNISSARVSRSLTVDPLQHFSGKIKGFILPKKQQGCEVLLKNSKAPISVRS